MTIKAFKCTFLSDIVLPATSNTEGKIDSLDFIPGSAFLGMVAKSYDTFEDPFTLFHSGAVQFGDASLLYKNKPTYKTPLSFYQEKRGEQCYNHHHIIDNYPNTQLKQLRENFISCDLEVIKLNYRYEQKSSYDSEKRHAKDGGMFGYNAITEGTKWYFEVRFEDTTTTEVIQKVISSLIGKQGLGKSRSAQYGAVIIEETPTIALPQSSKESSLYLYANSRLALFNPEGMPTAEPSPKNLGITSGHINWEKTQLRTSSYTPYNSIRQGRDATRLVIQKGSVIVLDDVDQADRQHLLQGVGAYLSEGFGQLLLNPKFLHNREIVLQEAVQETLIQEDVSQPDTVLVSFLQSKREEELATFSISDRVQDFVVHNKKSFENVSNAQWGVIRQLCAQESDASIETAVMDFISHGTAKEQWENGRKKLQGQLDSLAFTKLLAMQMPKYNVKEETDD